MAVFFDMERVESAEKCHNNENPGKDEAQLIDPAEDKIHVEEAHASISTDLHEGDVNDG
jgi:hypothetical protein